MTPESGREDKCLRHLYELPCAICDKDQQPAAESMKPYSECNQSDCHCKCKNKIAAQDAKIVDLQSQNVVLAQNALDRSFRIMELEEQSRISSEMLTSRWERIADLERQLKEAHEKKIVR